MNINHTDVFKWNYDALNNKNIRFIINQGGSRSSKTYSLCQLIAVYCLTNKNKIVSIVRKSFPSLRGSVMRDFFDVLKELDIYNEKNHNKTENIYKFDTGTIVEFFSADNGQKLRGRKRDILWANEANELSFEEFNQFNMRTVDKLFFDFNPSDMFHWLYDVIAKPDATLIKSTYKNNPFLSKDIVRQIEDLINVDEDYYRVYALGEKSVAKSTIYTHQKMVDDIPFEPKEVVYGLDFGYNHPCSLIECSFYENKVYVKEIVYKSGMTSGDLINEMNSLNISKNKYIVCDYARPEIIEDLKRSGYNAVNADKSVKDGIDAVKSMELFVDKSSTNLQKEFVAYKWKTKGEMILDEPIKLFDDGMDAMRYAIKWWKNKGTNYGDVDIMVL